MGADMPDYVISLLAQIPLVGIFVWFVLVWSDRMEKSAEKREKAWREFLEDQRKAANEAIGRLAEEIKENTQQLVAVKTIVDSHDQRMGMAVAEMKARKDR